MQATENGRLFSSSGKKEKKESQAERLKYYLERGILSDRYFLDLANKLDHLINVGTTSHNHFER